MEQSILTTPEPTQGSISWPYKFFHRWC